MNPTAFYEYVISNGTRLFTVVILPDGEGKFPVIVIRNPYVDALEEVDEEAIVKQYLTDCSWLKHGYAVVIPHCRGTGKSDGDCIPYINEHDDTLNLYEWIRRQSFYDGVLLPYGNSYLTSVHYCAAPFAPDIKGAIFGVQDTERYNICYRNGVLKRGLHTTWYVKMYKKKTMKTKNFSLETNDKFLMLPLKDFSTAVFGEPSADLDEMLLSPKRSDPFWSTHNGGTDARNATDNAPFPILFTTGFYDIYTGGIFDMWNAMSAESKARSVLLVSPYDHGSKPTDGSLTFENGIPSEAFGRFELQWFDHVVKGTPSPFELGKVTYYRIFDNKWVCDEFACPEKSVTLPLGSETVSYVYDPNDPPRFNGGLSSNFGGSPIQDAPNLRSDTVSVYTKPFEDDTFVKGRMTAKLKVASDCEDTGFYIRVSITAEKGDFPLRDDITSLCYQLGDYQTNAPVTLDFTFDEHAFLIKKGARLRIDIASANADHYVRHTNIKGLYSTITTTKKANNTVFLDGCTLTLPIENQGDKP